jgi:hypothetical protein
MENRQTPLCMEDVDETLYIALNGQNKIFYAKHAYFQCSQWQ